MGLLTGREDTGSTRARRAGELAGGPVRAVRAVLLDVLGTLVALDAPGPRLVRALARDHGIALDPAQAARAFAREMSYYRAHHCEGRDEASLAALRRRCSRVLADALGAGPASGLAVAELERAMLASLRFRAHPDALPALAALRERGVRLVAVSNWDAALGEVLARVGLVSELDGWVASAAVGHAKPAPEIFRLALSRASAGAEESLHVGDSAVNDVAGALGAGIAAVLLRREPSGGGAPAGAADGALAGALARVPATTPVIGTLAELPAIVDRGLPA